MCNECKIWYGIGCDLCSVCVKCTHNKEVICICKIKQIWYNFVRLKQEEEIEELGINRTVVEHVVRKWFARASTGVLCLRSRSSNRFFWT